MSIAYRAEIDGLRTVAVVPVILFHLGLAAIPGGFVGVDVFFVVSGYLIGSILWQEKRETGRISLVRFYVRRFKRLLPAFAAVAVATLLVGWFVLLPPEFMIAGRSLVAATVYLSNVYFYENTGYFDTASEMNPFLHTWSLAVEEQFYLLLPALVILLGAKARRFGIVIGALTVMSLIACALVTPLDKMAAFYLFPFRAWELFAGVLLGVFGGRVVLGSVVRGGLHMLGLVLLLAAFVFIDGAGAFPGVIALLPVIGTLLLLLPSGERASGTHRVLSAAPFVWCGRLSYSLYLWHWPVIVFARYLSLDELTPLGAAISLAATVVLAVMSYVFIETPLRRSRWRAPVPVFGAVAVVSSVLVLAGFGIHGRSGFPDRYEGDVLTHVAAARTFNWNFSACRDAGEAAPGLDLCPIGTGEGAPTVLVWGDSHARAIRDGVDAAAREAGVTGELVWMGGCPPLFDVRTTENVGNAAQTQACAARNERVRDYLAATPSIRSVVLVGRWAYYAEGRGVGDDEAVEISLETSEGATGATAFETALQDTLMELSASGRVASVLAQAPEVPFYDAKHAARLLANGGAAGRAKVQESFFVPRADVMARQASSAPAVRRAAAASGARVLDPARMICDARACGVMADGGSLYYDNNHLTRAGALRIRRVFDPALRVEG